jgi:hypothetical protein
MHFEFADGERTQKYAKIFSRRLLDFSIFQTACKGQAAVGGGCLSLGITNLKIR